MLLIDNGVIISLDFSGSIFNKNVGGTFYKDNFDFWKTTLLFINCYWWKFHIAREVFLFWECDMLSYSWTFIFFR